MPNIRSKVGFKKIRGIKDILADMKAIRKRQTDGVSEGSQDMQDDHGDAEELLLETIKVMSSLIPSAKYSMPDVSNLIAVYKSIEKWYS